MIATCSVHNNHFIAELLNISLQLRIEFHEIWYSTCPRVNVNSIVSKDRSVIMAKFRLENIYSSYC